MDDEVIKKSIGKLLSDDEDQFSDPGETSFKSEEVDETSLDDFSKESSIKFSEHDSHELVLTEAHRDGLVKKNEELASGIKAEFERSSSLTRRLFEFLTKQGISCQRGEVEDEVSVDEYNALLERLFDLDKKNKLLTEAMQKRSAEGMATKQAKQEAMDRLQTEFTEMIAVVLADPSFGTCPPEKFVAKLIKRFGKAYETTSLVRLEFLVAQHALVELIEKEKDLSTIGDGWKTLDYDNLTNEVQTVSSTIDLKQEQMEKLWNRFRSENRALAAKKVELSELQESIDEETLIHDSMREIEISTLLSTQSLDEEKKILKEKISDLSHRAGILSRTSLMKHFDAVAEEIGKLSPTVSKMEALNVQLSDQNREIQKKIKSSKVDLTSLPKNQLSSKNSKSNLADCLQICKIVV